MPVTDYEIDIRQAITLSTLSRLLAEKHSVRTLQRYVTEGRNNKFTGERIYLSHRRSPSGNFITTMGAYEHFVRELNRRVELS